jgi:hypothetical protein
MYTWLNKLEHKQKATKITEWVACIHFYTVYTYTNAWVQTYTYSAASMVIHHIEKYICGTITSEDLAIDPDRELLQV